MSLSSLSDAMIRWAACLSCTISSMEGFAIILEWLGLDGHYVLAIPAMGVVSFITIVQVIKPWPRPPKGWLGPWFGNPKTGRT